MKISHLNSLRTLEAVLRLGNFRAASAELGVTPAAVGQQVRSLEAYVGQSLFTRTPQGVVPTDIAQRLAAPLGVAFVGLADVLEELRRSSDPRRLAIAATEALTESWLSPGLHEFLASCGAIDLRLSAGPRTVDLLAGGFDFAIRYGPVPPDSLEWVPLFPNYTGPMCTPEFAQRYDISGEAPRLSGVLVDSENHTQDSEWVDWPGWCDRFGFDMPERRVRPSFEQFDNAMRMARAGLGMVIGGMVECFPAIQKGELLLPYGPRRIVRGTYIFRLVWVRGRRLTPVQRAFRDWIVNRAAAYCREIEAHFGEAGAGLMQTEGIQ